MQMTGSQNKRSAGGEKALLILSITPLHQPYTLGASLCSQSLIFMLPEGDNIKNCLEKDIMKGQFMLNDVLQNYLPNYVSFKG